MFRIVEVFLFVYWCPLYLVERKQNPPGFALHLVIREGGLLVVFLFGFLGFFVLWGWGEVGLGVMLEC